MKYSINQQKFLSPVELDNLLQTLVRNKDQDPRNVALISVLLNTGARSSEVLSLRWKDLGDNGDDKTLWIRGLKGSNDREIPIPKWLFTLIDSLRAKQTGPLIFDISRKRLYQIWDLYRPVRKGAHSLRHTFAINLYIRTRDIRLVQTALGHRGIENTMVYVNYIYSRQELKRLLL